jgi:hypothetical protein
MRKQIFYIYGGVKDSKAVRLFFKGGEYRDCLPYLQQPTVYVLNLIAADFEVPPETPDPALPKPDKDVPQKNK